MATCKNCQTPGLTWVKRKAGWRLCLASTVKPNLWFEHRCVSFALPRPDPHSSSSTLAPRGDAATRWTTGGIVTHPGDTLSPEEFLEYMKRTGNTATAT